MNRKSVPSFAALGAVAALVVGKAWAFDLFSTEKYVLHDPAHRASVNCQFGTVGTPLTIGEAVERAICYSPKSRQARDAVKISAAQLGVSRSAWLPKVSAGLDGQMGNLDEEVRGRPEQSFNVPTRRNQLAANLNWVLYDFGYRSANDEAARQQLFASLANEESAIQEAIATGAQAYYDAATAHAMLATQQQQERDAGRSLAVTQERHRAGAAAWSEELLAQTAYSQATTERINAERTVHSADGKLAVAMGLRADSPLSLLDLPTPPADQALPGALAALMEQAERNHPAIKAAQAALAAAGARVRATEANGLPTLSVIGSVSRARTRGEITVVDPAHETQKLIGLELSIPISDFVARNYQIHSAAAQEEQSRSDLDDTALQVSQALWDAYYGLLSANDSLRATADLLTAASQSFEVATARYRSGASTILELLTAQSALNNARKQRYQTASDWFSARLKLIQSLGSLDAAAVRGLGPDSERIPE